MDKTEWGKLYGEQEQHFLLIKRLKEHDSLSDAIHLLLPITGIIQNMFCNGFMFESVELLKHALFLYEVGYFDCAFYSLRQSIEILNNMLLLADDEERLVKWKAKEKFPPDKKVKDLLIKQSYAYKEIKNEIPEFFETYNELLLKANKYIHKQGFDTFYIYHMQETEQDQEQRESTFTSLLKNAIGMVIIMNIALDPLALALSDPDVDKHIPFEPMTQGISTKLLDELFSADIIKKIKKTNHYKAMEKHFLNKEQINEVTYLVIRCQHFDVSRLDCIEDQMHLLNLHQVLMLCILQTGVKLSHFYTQEDYIGYSTSYEPKNILSHQKSDQFDEYFVGNGKQNILWNDMFISVFKALGSYLIMQHNDALNAEEIGLLELYIEIANKRYQQCVDEIAVLTENK